MIYQKDTLRNLGRYMNRPIENIAIRVERMPSWIPSICRRGLPHEW
jgi:hypothetical protein